MKILKEKQEERKNNDGQISVILLLTFNEIDWNINLKKNPIQIKKSLKGK